MLLMHCVATCRGLPVVHKTDIPNKALANVILIALQNKSKSIEGA